MVDYLNSLKRHSAPYDSHPHLRVIAPRAGKPRSPRIDIVTVVCAVVIPTPAVTATAPF